MDPSRVAIAVVAVAVVAVGFALPSADSCVLYTDLSLALPGSGKATPYILHP